MKIPGHTALVGPIGRFLGVPASCLGPCSRRPGRWSFRGTATRARVGYAARISSHRSCCCFFAGTAAVDGLLYADWPRSVSSGCRSSSTCCRHFRFRRRMVTTSAAALESLRRSICFSWHGRLPGSDALCARKTGLRIRRRGVGGIRGRCRAARAPHRLFDMAPRCRRCGPHRDAGDHLYDHGPA